MKAKTYYANSLALTSRLKTPNHLNTREGYGDVPVKVIKQSDVEKLIEVAAKAQWIDADNLLDNWTSDRPAKRMFLSNTRAAFKAIGLLP